MRAALILTALLALASAACGEDGDRSPTAVAPSPAVAVSATPAPPVPWLLYADQQGLLRYTPEDGSRRRIGDGCDGFVHLTAASAGGVFAVQCQSPTTASLQIWRGDAPLIEQTIDAPFSPIVSFSNDGSRYAYFVPAADERATIAVYGEVRDGATPLRVDGVTSAWAWAPDGRLALCRARDSGCTVTIVDDAGVHDTGFDVQPRGWASDGRLLAAQAYVDAPDLGIDRYEAVLLNLESGERTRVPVLDDAPQLWFSPQGRYAARYRYDEAAQVIRMEVVELATGEARTIAGSRIGFPSEGIPAEHVKFEGDRYLWWADVPLPEATIYRAPLGVDAPDAERIATVRAAFPLISPDFARLAYTEISTDTPAPARLFVADINGQNATLVVESPAERPASYVWVAP
jgi:hypothetical protein